MKSYLAYIRVSTVKQGVQGSSLQQQRAAIETFARRMSLPIAGWFEETETAAKTGRRQFIKMLAALERGRADGVIIHKIDRSARNLKDWAHLGELIDRGVEVHFAHDSLDLTTRGGRLAADLQAVVAADFIRNLRDEVKKGRLGRLKQGFYPMRAPIGYLDRGRAKAKEIDPHLGALIRQAFELYGTGAYSLHMLRAELAARGLQTSAGAAIPVGHMARILHNPFYVGIMRVGATGETFEGNHEPLVPRALFDRVQAILAGRLYPRVQIHRFTFRRLIRCARCRRSLSGERQKGHVYYRCHDIGCRGVSVRELAIDALVRAELALLRVDERDVGDFREVIREGIAKDEREKDQAAEQAARDIALIEQRIERLTDAVLDLTIDKATYDARKAVLIAQKNALQDRVRFSGSTKWQIISEWFELGQSALLGYETGSDDEKRGIIKSVSSNLIVSGKQSLFPMLFPFSNLRNWAISTDGEPIRGAVRTDRKKAARNLLHRLAAMPPRTQDVEDESKNSVPSSITKLMPR